MKKFLTYVCLALILFAAVYACVDMGAMDRTYEGQNAQVSVYELQQDPTAYDDSVADGAAAVIVQQKDAPWRTFRRRPVSVRLKQRLELPRDFRRVKLPR